MRTLAAALAQGLLANGYETLTYPSRYLDACIGSGALEEQEVRAANGSGSMTEYDDHVNSPR
jgi:hypothetical protein